MVRTDLLHAQPASTDGPSPGISSIKQSGTCNANDVMDEVKAGKMTCMDTFQICRQAEDAAVQLVYTCGSGEVANNTKAVRAGLRAF